MELTNQIRSMLYGILQNQQALAKKTGVELPYSAIDTTCVQMPMKLRLDMLNPHAFDLAVIKGYIKPGEGNTLAWQMGTNTLLAYFLGRLFCGDTPVKEQRRGALIWKQEQRPFPGKALEQVFGVRNLRILRAGHKFGKVPQGHLYIDELFKRNAYANY